MKSVQTVVLTNILFAVMFNNKTSILKQGKEGHLKANQCRLLSRSRLVYPGRSGGAPADQGTSDKGEKALEIVNRT